MTNTTPPRQSNTIWRVLRWITLILLLVLVIAVAGFSFWALNIPDPMPEALAALESDDNVTVTADDGDWYWFTPAEAPPTTALIFYPGGKVDYRAYAPMAHAIATEGYAVAIPRVRLNLAILEIGAADPIIAAYPNIENWVFGGHSLGGSTAAFYADSTPDNVAGLFFVGSYPSMDLSASGIPALSVYGTLDGLATVEDIDASRASLPDDADFIEIEGGNHAQFGWYGDQSGDNSATVSRDEQQAQTVDAVVAFLAQFDA